MKPPTLTTTEIAMKETTQAPSPNSPLSVRRCCRHHYDHGRDGPPSCGDRYDGVNETAEGEELRNRGEANSSILPPSEHMSHRLPLATTAKYASHDLHRNRTPCCVPCSL